MQILESKGNLGLFCNTKKHLTQPQEFHFATDERFPPPIAVFDLFDKVGNETQSKFSIQTKWVYDVLLWFFHHVFFSFPWIQNLDMTIQSHGTQLLTLSISIQRYHLYVVHTELAEYGTSKWIDLLTVVVCYPNSGKRSWEGEEIYDRVDEKAVGRWKSQGS